MAQLSIRLGISPESVLDLDVEMYRMLIQVLNDQAKEVEQNARRNKRR